MKNKIIIILVTLSISCKSSIPYPTYKSISSYYKKELNNDVILKNPIVLEDDKLIGLYLSIDTNLFKYKFIHYNSIQILPKGYTYLNDFFGENAENGIIMINKRVTIRCSGYHPKRIYILDNKETTLEKLIESKTKYYYVAKFEGLKNKTDEDVEITILTVKKPKRHQL